MNANATPRNKLQAPNFLIAGAARSGTTAVVEALRAHPHVFITQPKEPHYFAFHGKAPDFRGPGDDVWVNEVVVSDRSKYLDLYRDAATKRARGDGSVTTLYYAQRAVPEILRINPEMRIVIILREPVDRAYSSYTYLRARGVEQESDFRAAIEAEARRREDNWQHMWHYTSMSMYADDLQTLWQGVGHTQLRVWYYDDLTQDFERALAEIVEFLGLPPFPIGPPHLPRVNVSGTPRSHAAQATIRWATRHPLVKAGIKRVVGFSTRERLRSAILRKDVLPSAVADETASIFADDLKRLRALLPPPHPPWLERAGSVAGNG